MPALVGRTLPAAKRELLARHCRLGAVSRAYSKAKLKGKVVAQKPRAGTKLAPNARVRVTLGRGPRR